MVSSHGFSSTSVSQPFLTVYVCVHSRIHRVFKRKFDVLLSHCPLNSLGTQSFTQLVAMLVASKAQHFSWLSPPALPSVLRLQALTWVDSHSFLFDWDLNSGLHTQQCF